MLKMKHKKIRIFALMIAALVMMGGFSVTAYAGGGEDEENIVPVTKEQPEETTGGYEPEPLTPEGNMTLVDDIKGESSGDKQFITVVTKNGNYFYIIIDRAEDGENTVHFLNQVDEADLLALMEDGTASADTPATCICTDKCAAGAVNTNCPVCKTDMTNCMGVETAAEPEPEPEAEESGGMGGVLIIVLILALGGGGAFYYFKVMKPKQSVKGGTDLDDYDFEDDEDEETEFEVFEDERADE
jgi:hypothetical protein